MNLTGDGEGKQFPLRLGIYKILLSETLHDPAIHAGEQRNARQCQAGRPQRGEMVPGWLRAHVAESSTDGLRPRL